VRPEVAFLLNYKKMEKWKKSIAVIDGQGGGIGNGIIKRLRENLAERVEIIH